MSSLCHHLRSEVPVSSITRTEPWLGEFLSSQTIITAIQLSQMLNLNWFLFDFVTASGTQDTNAGSVQMQECLFIYLFFFINSKAGWRSPHRAKQKTETPNVLSSITTLVESTAMKIVINKTLSTPGGKQKCYKRLQINSRSPVETDWNKRSSLKKTEALWNLTINLKHTFNGGPKIFKNQNTNRFTRGGTIDL